MAWTTCTRGHAHWGPRGAAGLLLAHQGQALLQLRARWAHQGGTWSIPGGALERDEDFTTAALRESEEELGIAPDAVQPRGTHVAECGGWIYQTVLAHCAARPALTDNAESAGHRWVPADEVDDLPLHPAFKQAWADGTTLRDFVSSA
jgi:8-oxo-dGTP diphosphatase